MKKRAGFLFVAFVALIGMYSCTKDKTTTAPVVNCTGVVDSTNTYSLNIGPNIVDNYCNISGCHDHASAAASDGIDMSDYAGVVNAFKNTSGFGSAICAVKGQCAIMPKTGRPLDTTLIKQMECWQANGYPQ